MLFSSFIPSPLLLENFAARVRTRGRHYSNSGSEADQTIIWIVISIIAIVIATAIVIAVLVHKDKIRKKIFYYFGRDGYNFIESLSPDLRRSLIQVVSGIDSLDTDIIKGRYDQALVNNIVQDKVIPHGQPIRANESLGWYRFVAYELDTLVFFARGQYADAKRSLQQAVNYRGDNELLSASAKKFAKDWKLEATVTRDTPRAT